MSEAKTLRDVKVGDEVFVVWQSRAKGKVVEGCTSTERVSQVGRKFASFPGRFLGTRYRFDRDTGFSVHDPDSNARANGYGFDVYVSREAYEREQYEFRRHKMLAERLVDRLGRLEPLKPDVVEAIHAVLDDAETEES